MKGKKAIIPLITEILPEIHQIDVFFINVPREKNDAANKLRERIIANIFDPMLEDFMADEVYGKKWTQIKEQTAKVCKQLCPSYSDVIIDQLAGRTNNYDFDFKFVDENRMIIKKECVEFKYGASSVSSLPQFLSLGANHQIMPVSYAEYYYTHYLQKYIELDPVLQTITIPSVEEYLKLIHSNNYDSHPLFRAMYNNENTNKDNKSKLVDESIKNFLEQNANKLNLTLLTTKIQETQQNKTYLMYKDGVLHVQKVEFSAPTSIVGVKNGNSIVVNAGQQEYHMLLRWRNHKGVMFPAWQISLKMLAVN